MSSNTDDIMATVKFHELETHDNDQNEYRHFTLPNGLDVMLIKTPHGKPDDSNSNILTVKAANSSPKSVKNAAVAVAVRVGHLCDPDSFPGLAHFLEHMLFMVRVVFYVSGMFVIFPW